MRGARRGVLMLAVLVVLAVAAIVASGLMAAGEAEHAGLAAMRDRTQQRATAWSGCQAVAAMLGDQRQAVAEGESPEIPAEILLFEQDGEQAIARLLPVGPTGEVVAPEMAKFSLATVEPAVLEATGVLESRAAAAAVARGKSSDAIESIVDPSSGLTASRVIGPVASGIAEGVRRLQDDGGGTKGAIRGRVRALAVADVATPFPAQRALGVVRGQVVDRVPVGEWSEDAIAAIDGIAGSGTGARMRDALAGAAPAHQGDLVRAMRLSQVPPERWGEVLDAVVAGDSAVERGLVDVSSAPEEVLRAVPGLGAELAAKVVQARGSLAAGERSNLGWLLSSSALTPEEFEAAAPMLCPRSWLWRVRVATGSVMPDSPGGDGSMRGIEVWEAVVDLAEEPPRFAALRDCTLLPVAAALAEEEREESDAEKADPEAVQVSDAELEDEAFADAAGDDAMPGEAMDEVMVETPGEDPGVEPAAEPAAAEPPRAPARGGDPESRQWQAREWKSKAAESAQQASDRIKAREDERREARKPREWRTLADREKEDRERESSQWRTLADREREEREQRSRDWKSLGQREAEDRAKRSKEWQSLGQEERQRREARDRAERERRSKQWEKSPDAFGGSSWERSRDLPATEPEDASGGEASGRDGERAPRSGASTGGLSGRWRRRGESAP